MKDYSTKPFTAKHVATVGDFVIRGVHGEFYFCKPDIFMETYEEVTGVKLNNNYNIPYVRRKNYEL